MTQQTEIQTETPARFADKSSEELQQLIKQVNTAAKAQYHREFERSGLLKTCSDVALLLGEDDRGSMRITYCTWQHKGVKVSASKSDHVLVHVDGKRVADSHKDLYVPGDWVEVVNSYHTEALQVEQARAQRQLDAEREGLLKELEHKLSSFGFTDIPELPEALFNEDDWVKITGGSHAGEVGQIVRFFSTTEEYRVQLKLSGLTDVYGDCLVATDPPQPPEPVEDLPEDDTEPEPDPILLMCLKIFKEDDISVAAPMALYISVEYSWNREFAVAVIIPAFEAVMFDKEADLPRRRAAARAIKAMGYDYGRQGKDALIKALESEDMQIRQIAVNALAEVADIPM